MLILKQDETSLKSETFDKVSEHLAKEKVRSTQFKNWNHKKSLGGKNLEFESKNFI